MPRLTLLLPLLGLGLLAGCGDVSTADLFGNTSDTGSGGAGGAGATSSATSTSSTSASTTAATSTSSTSASTTATTTTAEATTAATTSATSGSGGGVDAVGCSDGSREYFVDLQGQPDIAGCSGGFSVAGVSTPGSMAPACGRVAGNDSANPTGSGCTVEDLCSVGWHVCVDAADVGNSSSTGQCDAAAPNEFWLTRQVQDSQGTCAPPPAVNNITGCGTLGGSPQDPQSCAPLTNRMRAADCVPTQAWYCGATQADGAIESQLVVKVGPAEGGVLCCRD
jgi:hypothetical protein